jgi:hypothetical protein
MENSNNMIVIKKYGNTKLKINNKRELMCSLSTWYEPKKGDVRLIPPEHGFYREYYNCMYNIMSEKIKSSANIKYKGLQYAEDYIPSRPLTERELARIESNRLAQESLFGKP